MTHPSRNLDPLLAVVSARIETTGKLLEANAGFLGLLDLAKMPATDTFIQDFFIQPSFSSFLTASPNAAGEVYAGLLTIGQYTGKTRTLRARLWREDSALLLLAEHDIADLERLNSTVLKLNHDYAQAQFQLAQANLQLQASNKALQETQTKLVEAEKMAALGFLVAGIAHEVNTPLGVGLLAAGTLQVETQQVVERFSARTMTQSDLKNYLDKASSSSQLISQNLERIARLVTTFRKVAVQSQPVEQSLLCLRHCLDDVLSSLSNLLPAEQVTVHIDCPAELEIMGNPLDWDTIFGNLIRNSLHHGFQQRPAGRIDIAVKREANTLRVDYRDDGAGMSEEVLAHVFDPFFSTDLQHGMGLGMHLVYNLITHRMGGSVRCTSQPESGARFQIETPL